MSLVFFGVTAKVAAVLADTDTDSDYNPDLGSFSADVTFTPLIRSGDVVKVFDLDPPTMFVPVPITASVDNTDGLLKLRTTPDSGGAGTYAPLRLLGNSPSLDLQGGSLYYSFAWSNIRINNRPSTITIAGGAFQAPDHDTTIDLIDYMRLTGQTATGITRIAPGAVRLEDGDIKFSFGGVDIPAAIPFEPSFTSSEITDAGDTGLSVLTAETEAEARTSIGFRDGVKEFRTHVDLRDWQAVRDANWKSFLGATYTVGGTTLNSNPVTSGVPFTAADVGKIVMILIDSTGAEQWWKGTITGVTNGVATLDTAIDAGTGTTGRVRYGFDGTTAINDALAEVEASTSGPVDVYLGGSYRLTQLVIPEHVTLHGVRWKNQQVGQLLSGRTILRQLPGAEKDFVVFKSTDIGYPVLTTNGLYDLELRAPEKVVIGVDAATTGHGVAFRDVDGTPAQTIDGFQIARVHVYNFPESGFRCYGALPTWFDQCSAWSNGRYGFEYNPYSGNATYALHISNFSGDWNNLGLIGLRNMRYNDSVFMTGIKSESHVSSDEANSTRGGPNFQFNAIVFENCDRTTALINGVSHTRVARADAAPGPVIAIRDTGGQQRKPRLTFMGVHTNINESDPPADDSTCVTLRDEISSVDIPRTITSGFYPSLISPTITSPNILDSNGNKLLEFVETANATARLQVYNVPSGAGPTIAAADSTQSNVNIVLAPKGSSSSVAISGTNPTITGGAGAGNYNLDLRSRGTGAVKINGADALYSGGALGTPASGTLTNCTGLPVAGVVGATGATLALGAVELGHTSDTTITRSAAGKIAVEGVDVLLSGGALGTPASGTLTNCTGLPITGIVGATGATLTVGTIEVGHTSDTTIARTAAGKIAVEGVDVLLSGGALGTPSSGTLTNCTGLPVAGIAGSTATALGVGSIELGHASDTTIERDSAGIIKVEGVTVPLNSITSTHTAQQIELGHASDTTLTRSAAGKLAVEGDVLAFSVDTLDPDALTTGQATMSRRLITSAVVPSTNGVVRLTFFTARKTETVTQIRVPTGGTGASGATLCRIGLYSVDGSGNLTLVASTANDTALWTSPSTQYTKALSQSYQVTRGTRYAIGLLVVGSTTAPTFMGNVPSGAGAEFAESPRIAAFVSGRTDLDNSITAAGLTATTATYYSVLLPA